MVTVVQLLYHTVSQVALHCHESYKYSFISDNKIHTMGAGGKDACAGCITRTPYATLVAVIMCWAGVGVFCGTMYRCDSIGMGCVVMDYVAGGSTSP